MIGALALGGARAHAAGSVIVYCGVNEEWCRATATAFEKQSGIHVDMTRQSAGERHPAGPVPAAGDPLHRRLHRQRQPAASHAGAVA
jgi:hypothetical protein